MPEVPEIWAARPGSQNHPHRYRAEAAPSPGTTTTHPELSMGHEWTNEHKSKPKEKKKTFLTKNKQKWMSKYYIFSFMLNILALHLHKKKKMLYHQIWQWLWFILDIIGRSTRLLIKWEWRETVHYLQSKPVIFLCRYCTNSVWNVCNLFILRMYDYLMMICCFLPVQTILHFGLFFNLVKMYHFPH